MTDNDGGSDDGEAGGSADDESVGVAERRSRYVPTSDASDEATREFVAAHRLALAELPPLRLRALIAAAGGMPSSALTLSPDRYLSPAIGLSEKQVARLREAIAAPLPRLLERAAASGAYLLMRDDPLYPANLLLLSDAPAFLFVRGELAEFDRFSVAIVGTRHSSEYGQAQAARFAGAFAGENLTVVSGGAAGIDAAAHTGALNAGGRTLAVLGCGVDIVYPALNRSLFHRILSESRGALLSEFPLGATPEPWHFPTRNRIIAGIARASLFVETPDGSGALGTAKAAAEYGRDVYVVPGPVDSGRSRGGHRLIQDGAILADSPEDVMRSLGVVLALQEEPPAPPKKRGTRSVPPDARSVPPDARSVPPDARSVSSDAPALFAAPLAAVAPLFTPAPADLPPGEAAFLAALDSAPKHLDEAASAAGLEAGGGAVAATLLEMKGLIRRHPGNLFTRV